MFIVVVYHQFVLAFSVLVKTGVSVGNPTKVMEVCGCLLEVRHAGSWLEDVSSCHRTENKNFDKVSMAKYERVEVRMATGTLRLALGQPALAGPGPGACGPWPWCYLGPQPALAGPGFGQPVLAGPGPGQPALAGPGPGQPALAGAPASTLDIRDTIGAQVRKILHNKGNPIMSVTREFASTSIFQPIRIVKDLPAKIRDGDKRELVMRILATTGVSTPQRARLLARVAKLGGRIGLFKAVQRYRQCITMDNNISD